LKFYKRKNFFPDIIAGRGLLEALARIDPFKGASWEKGGLALKPGNDNRIRQLEPGGPTPA